ncbi:MAG: hypothetical protein WAK17_06235 [Candidatus Nitrosopolaris sp.]
MTLNGTCSFNGSSEGLTTEAGTKNRQRKAMTVKDFQMQVSRQGGGVGITATTRKNGTNGNMSLSVSASQTGLFQDVSNSDSLAVGDDYDYTFQFSNTGGGGQILQTPCAVTFVSTNSTYKPV